MFAPDVQLRLSPFMKERAVAFQLPTSAEYGQVAERAREALAALA